MAHPVHHVQILQIQKTSTIIFIWYNFIHSYTNILLNIIVSWPFDDEQFVSRIQLLNCIVLPIQKTIYQMNHTWVI